MNFEEFLARIAEKYSLSLSELYELVNSVPPERIFKTHDFSLENIDPFLKKMGIENVSCEDVVFFLETIRVQREYGHLID